MLFLIVIVILSALAIGFWAGGTDSASGVFFCHPAAHAVGRPAHAHRRERQQVGMAR